MCFFLSFQQVEDFLKGAERGVSELERVRQRVSGPKQGIRLSTAEETLAESSYLFTDTKELAQRVLQAGVLIHYLEFTSEL